MDAVVATVLTLVLAQQPTPTSVENLTEFSKLEDVWNQAVGASWPRGCCGDRHLSP